MPLDSDVRWKQRFQSFDRGLAPLREAVRDGITKLNPLEREGAARRFNHCLDLSWKTAKDYLEFGGVFIQPVSPRQVFKEACAARIVADGQVWIDMIDHRNLLAHTYDREVFDKAVEAVTTRYLPALEALHSFFSARSAE